MKAIVVHEFGSPDVMKLEEIATPEPGEGEVLVLSLIHIWTLPTNREV